MTTVPLASAISGRPAAGIDDRRRADHDHQVGVDDGVDRPLPRVVGQRLAEPHHVGPDQSAARAPRRVDGLDRFGHRGHLAVVRGLAAIATEFEQAAVQVVDVLAAGALVQVVDVLGDDVHVGVVLPGRDGAMAVVGLRPSPSCSGATGTTPTPSRGAPASPPSWRSRRGRPWPTARSRRRGTSARRSRPRCPPR